MQMNKNSKLARFYLLLGDSDLPDDFCTYFWGLIGRLLKIVVAVVLVGLILFALVLFAINLGILLWGHKTISGTMLAALALTAGLIWKRGGWVKLTVQDIYWEVEDVVETKVDSVKNRYCPKIDWRE